MSAAEILSIISVISYIVSGSCFVLAVFFWIKFRIPSVIGDLSGRTARKSIARMRESNENAGGQGYQPSAANASRGKLTDTMQHARKPKAEPKKAPPVAESQMPETGLLAANKAETKDDPQMDLLDAGETTGLLVDEGAARPLQEEPPKARRTGGKKLTMLDEVILIHTDEVI